MKTFKKSYLPESVTYKGQELKLNADATAKGAIRRSYVLEANWQQEVNNKTVCLVEVHNKNVKGKLDLYGNPYKPTVFIFSN